MRTVCAQHGGCNPTDCFDLHYPYRYETRRCGRGCVHRRLITAPGAFCIHGIWIPQRIRR